jgi:hypothetical protein
MLNMNLSVAFETWRDHAMRQARGESICQRVLAHWTHRTAAVSLECWRAHALEQKRMEQVCTRIVQKMLSLSLDVAMMTWKDHARKQQRATTVCARVVSHWQHRCKANAFESWHLHAKEQRSMEDLCSKVLRCRFQKFRKVSLWWLYLPRTCLTDVRALCLEQCRTRRDLSASFILFRLAAAICVIQNLHLKSYLKLPHLINTFRSGAEGLSNCSRARERDTGGRARERDRLNRKSGKRSISETRINVREKHELMARIENGWMKHAQDYWQAAEYECKVAREWFLQMGALYDHLCKQVHHAAICPVCSCFEYDIRK